MINATLLLKPSMQAVRFIENRASGVLLFLLSFFSLTDDESIGDRIRGCFFFLGVHIIPGLQSFAFCLQGNLHENTIISLYPSKRRSMGCKKKEKKKERESLKWGSSYLLGFIGLLDCALPGALPGALPTAYYQLHCQSLRTSHFQPMHVMDAANDPVVQPSL